jgi:LPXTG-site transpeptidase (sortase) family protein
MTVYVSAGAPRPRRVRRIALRLTAGALALVAAGATAHIAWTLQHDRAQVDAGQAALTQTWQRQPDLVGAVVAGRPAPGGPIGRLYVPRLHLDWIVVEGVDEADITAAPGHYPDSAMPGKVGNFAVAGHREVAMFADLDVLAPDDAVIVETRAHWYLYRVVSNRVVPKTALAEVSPVPPGMNAGRLLTLTTCWPRWGNSKRISVHAVLERSTPADQPPSELAGVG